jgi:hypothetical protein
MKAPGHGAFIYQFGGCCDEPLAILRKAHTV